MEDKTIKIFLCECDCEKAICDTIHAHDIDKEDYIKVLLDIKEWIEFIARCTK